MPKKIQKSRSQKKLQIQSSNANKPYFSNVELFAFQKIAPLQYSLADPHIKQAENTEKQSKLRESADFDLKEAATPLLNPLPMILRHSIHVKSNNLHSSLLPEMPRPAQVRESMPETNVPILQLPSKIAFRLSS